MDLMIRLFIDIVAMSIIWYTIGRMVSTMNCHKAIEELHNEWKKGLKKVETEALKVIDLKNAVIKQQEKLINNLSNKLKS